MEDFLRYLAKRRGQLQRDLADLETAERIFKASGAETVVDTPRANVGGELDAPEPSLTIKAACLRVLEEVAPKGLRAAEILAQIKARWKPNLSRAVMAPQLTRLGREKTIRREKGLWFLVKPPEIRRTEAPVGTGASAISGRPASSS